MFFVDPNGDSFSNVRILNHNTIGTKTNLLLELKTNKLRNTPEVYLLTVDYDTGEFVDKVKFIVNISFINDFEL